MVQIQVDGENRMKLRRLHTATHVLNFCLREVLGSHVWQNGSNLKTDIGTLDITHYENLTKEEIFEVEKRVNKIIFENKKVAIEELDRTQAEQKYGFTLYQGGAIPMKTLRVVKIEDNDIEACGGLHMDSTGGIGLVKIVDTQKIQDGVVRVSFVVNEFALNYIAAQQLILEEIKEVFSVDEKSIIRTSQKFFNEWKQRGKEIDNMKKSIADLYFKSILMSSDDSFKIDEEYDMGFIMELFSKVISSKPKFKLESPKFVIATPEFTIENFKKEINKGKFKIYIM